MSQFILLLLFFYFLSSIAVSDTVRPYKCILVVLYFTLCHHSPCSQSKVKDETSLLMFGDFARNDPLSQKDAYL